MLQPAGTSPQRVAGSNPLAVREGVTLAAAWVVGEVVGTALGTTIAGKGVAGMEMAVTFATTATVGCRRICSVSNWASSKAITTVAITPVVSKRLVRQSWRSADLFIVRLIARLRH